MTEKIRYEDNAEYTKSAAGWVCKKCHRFWGQDKHMASWCCATDLPCETEGCENRKTKPYAACEKCQSKQNMEREEKRLDSATLCEDDGNPFVVNDNFYLDMEDYVYAIDQGEDSLEEYAFMTRELSLNVSAQELWEDAIDRHEIDDPAAVTPEGMEEFTKAVDLFVEANKNLGWWVEDSSRKFRLPLEYIRKELEELREE